MNELSELSFIETPLMDRIGFLQLLLRFFIQSVGGFRYPSLFLLSQK